MKNVLLTGAAGTVGKRLVLKLLESDEISSMILLDNNESELFELTEYIGSKEKKIYPVVGDIRNKSLLEEITKNVDIIFHCAAYKHVIFSELNPFEYVQVNVIGTKNIIESAVKNGVSIVINTSTDKAVNPTNVMGASKLLAEKLITAANFSYNMKTKFASVRFGNVLGSRGSILPLIIKQIEKGGPVTLTHKNMTRFIMSVDEAVDLIINASRKIIGGEVFVLKMKSLRIIDLIEAVIEIVAPKFGYKPQDIEIVEVGPRPGEKLYEELMTEEEADRTMELEDMFVILPRFREVYNIRYDYEDIQSTKISRPYVSKHERFLSKDEIKEYLNRKEIINYCLEGVKL